jgi:transcriptional regulator with XRE-family HTH domain
MHELVGDEPPLVEASSGDDFATKLRRLIRTVHPPDRGPYSYREIARGVVEAGVTMTSTTLYQLANGGRPDPKLRHVQGLAAFFGVPVAYFMDEAIAARIDEQISSVVVWRDQEAQELALRTLALPADQRQLINGMLATIEEQLQQKGPRRRRSDTMNEK